MHNFKVFFVVLFLPLMVSAKPIDDLREFLGGFDGGQPQMIPLAGKELKRHFNKRPTAEQEAALFEYLMFVRRMMYAIEGSLYSVVTHTKTGWQKLDQVSKDIHPHGLIFNWCEGQSFEVSERSGYIKKLLKGFGEKRIQTFLSLRNQELSQPLGWGCEGFPATDLSKETYNLRLNRLKAFVEKSKDSNNFNGQLTKIVQSYIKRYQHDFPTYNNCLKQTAKACVTQRLSP